MSGIGWPRLISPIFRSGTGYSPHPQRFDLSAKSRNACDLDSNLDPAGTLEQHPQSNAIPKKTVQLLHFGSIPTRRILCFRSLYQPRLNSLVRSVVRFLTPIGFGLRRCIKKRGGSETGTGSREKLRTRCVAARAYRSRRKPVGGHDADAPASGGCESKVVGPELAAAGFEGGDQVQGIGGFQAMQGAQVGGKVECRTVEIRPRAIA